MNQGSGIDSSPWGAVTPTRETPDSTSVISGVEIGVGREAVWVRSAEPLRVLSSAVVGGELLATRHIVNMHVNKGYHGERPSEDIVAFARGLGIVEPFVGLMTAAWTHEAATVSEEADGVTVAVVATVGLGVPVAAGLSPPAPWRPSTINIVVVLDATLEPSAAVNGVLTATEAKVGALADARIVTPDGVPATGTLTDAVVVAWTGRGPVLTYLGPGAVGGWLLARAVRRAVGRGLTRA